MIRLVPLLIALACATATAGTLTLSPAVVPLGGKVGQSTQQHLTLFNGTSETLTFTLVAKDVVVRDGKREFVDAGNVTGSVAATAVFSLGSVTVAPGDERSVDVTLTLPARMQQRAVVLLFQGTTKLGNSTVSIGSLITFDLAGKASLTLGDLKTTPPTRSRNAMLALPVANDGAEPAQVRAAAVIVRADSGALVGRVAMTPHRLLPGERTVLETEYGGLLPSGMHRVLITVEVGRTAYTRVAELAVP